MTEAVTRDSAPTDDAIGDGTIGDATPSVLQDAAVRGPVAVIDTPAGYLDAVERLAAGTGPVAVDAERASGFRYSQRAYLLQFYREGAGTFLFDPVGIGSFDALQDALRDELWLLHAASQDLPCLREVGLDPHRLFDTELAARLLGFERVGLAAVVERLLGLRLAKEHSAADWSTRPLPASWLVYAALDVELLVDLVRAMRPLIEASGKERVLEQEFQAVLRREQKTPPAEPWRRLSGLHAVRGPRNLAVARELWLARDELARRTDIAPGRLVPDASLVAAARTPPTSKRELAAMRSFTGRQSRTEIDLWWSAIERGQATDDLPNARVVSDTLPPPRSWADRNPAADARLKAVRPRVAEVAEQLALPLENLVSPDTLRRIVWAPSGRDEESVRGALAALGARPWQIDAVAGAVVRGFVEARQPSDDTDAAHS